MSKKGLGACMVQGCNNKAIESHHIFPLSLGGADSGPRANLCPTHHTEVHRTADQVWKHELDLNSVLNPSIKLLAEGILKQKQEFERNGGIAPDARRVLAVSLTEEEQNMCRLIKNHGGFSSLEKMIKFLINREAERIFSGKA